MEVGTVSLLEIVREFGIERHKREHQEFQNRIGEIQNRRDAEPVAVERNDEGSNLIDIRV